MGFDRQPVLKGPQLVLRPLQLEDREALYEPASDPGLLGPAANFEMKSLMFDHAFGLYDEVWLDIGPDNI